MDFKPNSKAVQSLLEMGFDEKGIINALKVTGNNQINAVSTMILTFSILNFSSILNSESIIIFSVNGCSENEDIVYKI